MMIVIEVLMIVILLFVDHELGRRDAGAQDPFAPRPRNRRRARLPSARSQVLERQPGVEKRAEHHVAGNPGETVEVEHA